MHPSNNHGHYENVAHCRSVHGASVAFTITVVALTTVAVSAITIEVIQAIDPVIIIILTSIFASILLLLLITLFFSLCLFRLLNVPANTYMSVFVSFIFFFC